MTISLFDRTTAVLILMVLAGAASAQAKGSGPCFQHFGQREWVLLLETVPAESKTQFIENPEVRKQQTENLSQLFAYACDAVKKGIATERTNSIELKNIRSETIAVAFDREVAKQKTGRAFVRITAAQVERFYASPRNVSKFGEFLDAKISLLKRANPDIADRDPTADEKQQARSLFAKIKISEGEYLRSRTLKPQVRSRAELQARLQQAQFLARIATEKVVATLVVSDAEVDKYILEHPEVDTSKKLELAAKLLERAKAGEDFAELANQYTEDPGNNGSNGMKHGGLYSGVTKGLFVPPFEKAALSLEAGKLYPSLVESDFGYHIIKLEKVAGVSDDLKYDVRHILISTGYKNPQDPEGREIPLRLFVKSKLETEKESAAINTMLANNPVVVEDYAPPKPAILKKRVVRKRR